MNNVPSVSNALIIFAKAPRLGTVKTRLQSMLPAKTVRTLYIAFVRDTLAMVQRVRDVQRTIIAFTPADGAPLFRRAIGRAADGFEFIPQAGRDLGERMRHAFTQSAAEGSKRTVIIGTDSPSLPPRSVEEAFAVLARNDLVLGPSTDGGYYLIGVRRQRSEVRMRFLTSGIEWSTDRVLEQTVIAARRAKLKIRLLAPWYDVDDETSLQFLRTHLKALAACGSPELSQHSWRVLRQL
jgi:rSAM/selenodomain-associated transferase 1